MYQCAKMNDPLGELSYILGVGVDVPNDFVATSGDIVTQTKCHCLKQTYREKPVVGLHYRFSGLQWSILYYSFVDE